MGLFKNKTPTLHSGQEEGFQVPNELGSHAFTQMFQGRAPGPGDLALSLELDFTCLSAPTDNPACRGSNCSPPKRCVCPHLNPLNLSVNAFEIRVFEDVIKGLEMRQTLKMTSVFIKRQKR